jgi:hypothetical protein
MAEVENTMWCSCRPCFLSRIKYNCIYLRNFSLSLVDDLTWRSFAARVASITSNYRYMQIFLSKEVYMKSYPLTALDDNHLLRFDRIFIRKYFKCP